MHSLIVRAAIMLTRSYKQLFLESLFVEEPQIIELPETPSTSRKDEKVLAKKVLHELNSTWEKFNHTFSTALPQNVPEARLCAKISRTEKKHIQKRQLAQHM